MTRTEWPTRERDEKPLEIVAHTCRMREAPGGRDFHTDYDASWRPVGSCWRCPECWKWWVAKRFVSGSSSVVWRRVRPLTPTWWRCRRAAKELR